MIFFVANLSVDNKMIWFSSRYIAWPNSMTFFTENKDDEDCQILEDLKVAKESLERLQYVFPECDNILIESQDPNNDVCNIGLLETTVFDQREVTDVIVPGMGGVHGPLIQKWLQENFEDNDDATIPRVQVYTAYLSCCDLYGIKPINAATFGKVVRTVFPHVRTRRIGVRGHSKYHYCGIGLRQKKNRSSTDNQRLVSIYFWSHALFNTEVNKLERSTPSFF
ncbi:hypothetical protein FSP39_002340 [Pinctada imbricata]|uniref:RFX-type winged-helix domain-containing protein n=1 Tax=Pinctada imbricata TaxID=66713 RepID=A0AA89BTX5_PINIB|nr:hypothetical protein FSP39_002340 [Pinctada imbricata]